MLVSPALLGIENCLERRVHYNTDPNAINDELRADSIIRIILGKISEM